MFLKSKTKTDRKPAVKVTLQYKLSSAFYEKGKIARKTFFIIKKRSFGVLSFEGKHVNFGASKPKLRRIESRPFCTISASTFWKIHPYLFIHSFVHSFIHLIIYLFIYLFVSLISCLIIYFLSIYLVV